MQEVIDKVDDHVTNIAEPTELHAIETRDVDYD